MKRLIASRGSNMRVDPRKQFGAAWIAAFLGFALTIGVVFWAMTAYP